MTPDHRLRSIIGTHGIVTSVGGFGAHALRATAATNALDHQAHIAKVQEWFGHANIASAAAVVVDAVKVAVECIGECNAEKAKNPNLK